MLVTALSGPGDDSCGEEPLALERHLLTQHSITGARHLVRERLLGEHHVPLPPFAFVEAFRLGQVAQRELRRFHECPGEIRIAVLAVALALLFAVAGPLTVDQATVRGEVPGAGETADVATSNAITSASTGPTPVTVFSSRYIGVGFTRESSVRSSASICSPNVSITARVASTLSVT